MLVTVLVWNCPFHALSFNLILSRHCFFFISRWQVLCFSLYLFILSSLFKSSSCVCILQFSFFGSHSFWQETHASNLHSNLNECLVIFSLWTTQITIRQRKDILSLSLSLFSSLLVRPYSFSQENQWRNLLSLSSFDHHKVIPLSNHKSGSLNEKLIFSGLVPHPILLGRSCTTETD